MHPSAGDHSRDDRAVLRQVFAATRGRAFAMRAVFFVCFPYPNRAVRPFLTFMPRNSHWEARRTDFSSSMISLTANKAVATSTHTATSPPAPATMATPTTNSTTAPATSTASTATTFNFLRRIRTRVVDFFLPENIRQEYRRIIAPLAKYRYAFVALAASTLFAIAEYEQPGYFPRPQELTNAVVCTSRKLRGRHY